MLDKARDNAEKHGYKKFSSDKVTLKKEYLSRIIVWMLLQVIVLSTLRQIR
jgi:hypothetical protein